MMIFANTHNHSTFSDGEYTPDELARLAKREGYGGIVLTDHDTTQGYYFMNKAARKEGLLTILGCEFSTVTDDGFGIHLLGYDFNPDEPNIRKLLSELSERQRERTHWLFDKAVEKGNIKGIIWDDILKEYPYNEYICNNHIFELLVKKGLRKREDYFSFFDPDFKWNKDVEPIIEKELDLKQLPRVYDVIKMIINAGGVPIVAHPHNHQMYIDRLYEAGLMGIEISHPELTAEEKNYYEEYAKKRNMYMTGGTDHSGILGGLIHLNRKYDAPIDSGYATKEDFMKLYRRELG